MNFGFIYCLGNQVMPGVFKIGMTERAPAQRCVELSSATSAPTNFDLLCFGQVAEPRAVEAALHDLFAPHRVSQSREFFQLSFAEISDAIEEYSDGFALTAEGAMQHERERLMEGFLAETDRIKKAHALIAAARFEGVSIWREGGELKVRGALRPSSWISGAVHAMRPQLLEAAAPEIRLAVVMEEELD